MKKFVLKKANETVSLQAFFKVFNKHWNGSVVEMFYWKWSRKEYRLEGLVYCNFNRFPHTLVCVGFCLIKPRLFLFDIFSFLVSHFSHTPPPPPDRVVGGVSGLSFIFGVASANTTAVVSSQTGCSMFCSSSYTEWTTVGTWTQLCSFMSVWSSLLGWMQAPVYLWSGKFSLQVLLVGFLTQTSGFPKTKKVSFFFLL